MPIWQPSEEQAAATNLAAFIRHVNQKHGLSLSCYDDIHRWSIDEMASFWAEVWVWCDMIGDPGKRVVVDVANMMSAKFFPDATLNFAENLLRRNDNTDALVFWGEDQARDRVSWRELNVAVSRLAQALQGLGVKPGDRVAALLPNIPEAVVGMLAATSIGAVWSSCSPDFGEQAVLDRFGQIEPKALLACDGYFYAGKTFDVLPKLPGIVDRLPSLKIVVVVPYMRRVMAQGPTVADVRSAVLYEDFIAPYDYAELPFPRFPFDHPLYILFSSGTTGVPKCIVHSVGGTLIQHLKEHQFHTDIKPGDRVFYFTTCTWMMWNWLVSALASEATLLLYDGSPFHPSRELLFDYADAERMTHFGTSAKFIDALRKDGVHPRSTHDLSSVRLMASTGSPLVAESYDFVYRHIKEDICLASISGGTDIVSCFVSGNPLAPVYRGEISCAGLGMSVEVWDEKGVSVSVEKGELVCTRAFPSMPLGFWGDVGDQKYHAAYFDQYPGVWAHGDFASVTERGGFVIYGRSDATLNPGGVRIGTAEIYRQVEQIDQVMESLAIGQVWEGDVRVVLFVVLRGNEVLTEELIEQICSRIRSGASPRHVPAKIIQVADIPRTRSGKIVELAVRDVVAGRTVRNVSALANPEAIELFRGLPDLRT